MQNLWDIQCRPGSLLVVATALDSVVAQFLHCEECGQQLTFVGETYLHWLKIW